MPVSEKVKIIVPIYKADLNENELISLEQCRNLFKDFPKIFVKPKSLDISNLKKENFEFKEENFDDDFFTGIAGYNRLMMSSCFYDRFLDSEYILIHQLDTFAFRNELLDWCEKKYDYIGAPWMLKPKYRKWHVKLFLYLKSFGYFIQRRPFWPTMLGDKVGNGGLSLRKVASHYESTIKNRKKICSFLSKSQKHSEFSEDVFWALENPGFKYPNAYEALGFSIDNYPEMCFKLNKSKLPFGCHGWSKPEKITFWKHIILSNRYLT